MAFPPQQSSSKAPSRCSEKPCSIEPNRPCRARSALRLHRVGPATVAITRSSSEGKGSRRELGRERMGRHQREGNRLPGNLFIEPVSDGEGNPEKQKGGGGERVHQSITEPFSSAGQIRAPLKCVSSSPKLSSQPLDHHPTPSNADHSMA